MLARQVLGILVAAALPPAASLVAEAAIPSAAADPCPDIEVIFARGTGGSGLGQVGSVFVDALRSRVGSHSLATYSVNYPASFDFQQSAPLGAADAADNVVNFTGSDEEKTGKALEWLTR